MKCWMPSGFKTGETLDPERLNAGLRALSECIGDNLDRRYTHWSQTVDLDGLADTDPLADRFVPLNSSNTARRVTLVGIELYIPSGSGTWTVTSAASAWRDDITLDTSELAEKIYEGTELELAGSTDYLELTGDAGAAITRGWLVLHYRSDRAGTADHSGYTPALFDDTDTDDPDRLNDGASGGEWNKVAAAVGRDLANDADTAPLLFTRRGVPTGGLRPEDVFQVPDALAKIDRMIVTASGPNTETVVVELYDANPTLQMSVTLPLTGTGTIDVGEDTLGVTQSLGASSFPAFDWTLEIRNTGPGTIDAVHVLLMTE